LHRFALLSAVIIALARNDFDTGRKLRRRWDRPATDRD
jgi:hypothetical protein